MRRTVPLSLVLASAIALAACGQHADLPASPARPTSSDDPKFLPLAAYDMPDDDGRTVGKARWTLAKECMVRLGFDGLKNLVIDPMPAWPQRPAGTGVVTAVLYASDDFRYGIQDPEQAARYGYHAVQADYQRRYPEKKWTLPQYLALTGEFVGDDPKTVHGHRIPKRGCLGEADRTIYGTNRQDRKDPVLDLESKSLQQGMRDPAWNKAAKAWSACMRKAGYHYATPKDAEIGQDRERQELEERLSERRHDPDEPSALEKETATADARCKQRTGYVRTVHAIDVRIQNQLIAKNRPKLEEQRRWNRDAARKAHDILEDRS
ncbi:lipoprotein [Streptomyces sp. NPDC001530]|uniref:LptM family lipoprotein n=1 Tax=Streptomyces sp. NPDC001530 TaxID=3364582 RepID=UPI00367D5943